MKRFLPYTMIAALLCLTFAVHAGQNTSTPIQAVAEELRAATLCQNATGATQQTLTFTVAGSNCAWFLTNIDVVTSATTAPAATLLTTTTTNLGGWKAYTQAPAATFQTVQPYVFNNGIRGSLGANVTIVSNAAVTNVVYSLNACGYQVCNL